MLKKKMFKRDYSIITALLEFCMMPSKQAVCFNPIFMLPSGIIGF